MSLFLQALLGGVGVAVLLLVLWRLLQRSGLTLPRARPARRRLLCVRPLDIDAGPDA